MLLQIWLMIIVFIAALVMLTLTKLNKKIINEIVYFQYNFIPEPLISLVNVIRLK
ncbi:ac110-like protein [Cryptophlebia peltastica nucleopolyhedrovirus]|uniref:Ac110-like protein n=1 Tax=Cryptophlebia peltastica nucleopolyhedrovirus TaxID=2304025 RepID=A0A346RNV2_9ABAC|nr:ac110-like protein [Cryptophlebia peltastica nucleopolyhedrovirus]AXS67749.1 ac110-like protein [Cryptophlebia peltastica nucleopolyhedrovirus]